MSARKVMLWPLAERAHALYAKSLHRFLMRRLSNAEGARDLAQEVYLRLVRVPHDDLIRYPQAYLFRIASNLMYELRLQERRDPVTFDSRIADYAAHRVSDPAHEPAEQLSLEYQLESMLERLPPLYAAILVMKKRDGKSYAEIARELCISEHTVKAYLARAIARCRAMARLERYD
jgi:RNA polymerase sigma factor (sigma-70 family)